LPENGWFGGREIQSIAFFSGPGIEKLYSGVAMRIASASATRRRSSSTGAGKPSFSISPL
jgi:hypothetical protein